MKIGVSKLVNENSIDVATWARKAEELGFESIWVPEHVAIPTHTTSPRPGHRYDPISNLLSHIIDPFVVLAQASAVTTTIKLATGVCLVTERHPIMLAKQVASLDYVSGGRFLFGVGTGWLKEEMELFELNFKDRGRYTRESVLAMKELWTKEEAEYHGKLIDFPPVKCFPKPVQQPHPPVLVGGLTPAVLRRVADYGDGWIPARATPDQVRDARRELDRLCREAGRDPTSLEISVFCENAGPELLQEYEAAGATRAIRGTTSAPEAEAIARLEEIASEVLNR